MLSPRCVTLLLPPGLALTSGALETLLALQRRRCGKGAAPWAGADVDAFRGPGGTLLLVRETPCTAALADYALPFLHKYFTDLGFFSL